MVVKKGRSSKVKQRILVLYLQLFKFFVTILTVCLVASFLCSSSRKTEKLRNRNLTAFNSVSDSGNTLMIDAFLVKENAILRINFSAWRLTSETKQGNTPPACYTRNTLFRRMGKTTPINWLIQQCIILEKCLKIKSVYKLKRIIFVFIQFQTHA